MDNVQNCGSYNESCKYAYNWNCLCIFENGLLIVNEKAYRKMLKIKS
jgi:hypothetical protein